MRVDDCPAGSEWIFVQEIFIQPTASLNMRAPAGTRVVVASTNFVTSVGNFVTLRELNGRINFTLHYGNLLANARRVTALEQLAEAAP